MRAGTSSYRAGFDWGHEGPKWVNEGHQSMLASMGRNMVGA